MRARFDDRSGLTDVGWEFAELRAHGRAEHLDQVLRTIDQAERRAADFDEWVVMVVAYEAAPAFDPVMRTAVQPPDGTPFVWWASFADRLPAEPLPVVTTRVIDRIRAANRLPYPDAVRAIRQRIEFGDVYQVNTTDRFHGHYDGTPFEMYAGLVGVQSCAYGAYIEMGERVVASASPEMFLRWDDELITCRPMKGTAARHPRPERDLEVGASLQSSVKDRAENVMIVDLLRNDLSRLAKLGTVRVPTLFALERYETVWQLTSDIQAEMPDETRLVDVFSAMFPCGSVTGAPKISAMSIIESLEVEPRGVYCGAIGYLSPPGKGPRAVFSVPIRTAVLDPVAATFVYGAGGGITWSSDPDDEDDEVRAKARILSRSRRAIQLFETLRHDARGVLNRALHLDRLEASARWFGFQFDRAALEAQLAVLPAVAEPHRLRLVVERDGSTVIEQDPLDEAPVPVRLAVDKVVTLSDDPFSCHKTTWRRHYTDARRRHPDADDVVLVNEHGRIIETTIANVLYRIGDQWFTPPLDDGGLPGIGRKLALASGEVRERPLAADEVASCDELALINDLRGRRPAVLIGSTTQS
jgi:para-aminobenzoate synthetase / 4-amino-4-deoxychorismate lyase